MAAAACLALDAFLWWQVAQGAAPGAGRIYFLDVGQGDSELAILPGGEKILTDGGPDGGVIEKLDAAMPAGDRYIDLVVVSHPQLDHFNGLRSVLARYEVGAILLNGRTDAPAEKEWQDLMRIAEEKGIPRLTVRGGDKVRIGRSGISFLGPSPEYLMGADVNNTALVERVSFPEFTALLAGDLGSDGETDLTGRSSDLKADILKISHHGSKFSSGAAFLAAVAPRLAFIEVGAGNRYGHPAKETLARLASSSIPVFRTDEHGTIEVLAEAGKLRVAGEK